jgi:hypothetical protein
MTALADAHPVVLIDVPVIPYPDTVELLLNNHGCLNPMERAAELCSTGHTRFYAGEIVYRAYTIPDRDLDAPRARVASVPQELTDLRSKPRFSPLDASCARTVINTMLETRTRFPEGERGRWCAMHSPALAALNEIRWRILTAEALRGHPEIWELVRLNNLLRPLGLLPLPTTMVSPR